MNYPTLHPRSHAPCTRAHTNASSLAHDMLHDAAWKWKWKWKCVTGSMDLLFSSCFFFVFLFLLPDRLVSWPSRLHGCISLGHESLPFCRTLSLPLHFLHSSLFVRSAFLSDRAEDATLVPSSRKSSFLPSEISLVNELSDVLHVSWFTTIPVNRFAIRGDIKFASAVCTGNLQSTLL